MLEDLLPRWRGKAFVLVLLGFAATDFVITITLSAADATEHIIHNPFVPKALDHPVGVTLVLLALLGAVFLKGFKEAIGLAVAIVVLYLLLNTVVIGWGLLEIAAHPDYISRWKSALLLDARQPADDGRGRLLVFPKLALGLSGFETGVAVMPLVKGDPDDDPEPSGRANPEHEDAAAHGRAHHERHVDRQLDRDDDARSAEAALREGGEASGRALSYLAHQRLGEAFGTVYDISTIAILWFAGASAMAGLLNLVPRYLPRYGMAPEWTRATRPLVVLFTAITFLITVIFKADVEAQGGAYATGVLVLMTSAAFAVTLRFRRSRRLALAFGAITLVFVYTTVAEHHRTPGRREDRRLVHRHDHRDVARLAASSARPSCACSGWKPTRRRGRYIREAASGPVAHHRQPAGYRASRRIRPQAAGGARLAPPRRRRARAVRRGAPGRRIRIRRRSAGVAGIDVGGHQVLRCVSPAVPNAIAALLLNIRDVTGQIPTPTSAGPKAIRLPTC